MVLGLDCFGFMERKASKSSTQKEDGDSMKQKENDVAEEASPKAGEKMGDKAEEKKSKDTGGSPCCTSFSSAFYTWPALIFCSVFSSLLVFLLKLSRQLEWKYIS